MSVLRWNKTNVVFLAVIVAFWALFFYVLHGVAKVSGSSSAARPNQHERIFGRAGSPAAAAQKNAIEVPPQFAQRVANGNSLAAKPAAPMPKIVDISIPPPAPKKASAPAKAELCPDKARCKALQVVVTEALQAMDDNKPARLIVWPDTAIEVLQGALSSLHAHIPANVFGTRRCFIANHVSLTLFN